MHIARYLPIAIIFSLVLLSSSVVLAAQHPNFVQFASPIPDYTMSKSFLSFPTNQSTDTITVSITDSAIYRYVNTSFNAQNWVQRSFAAGTPSSCTSHPDDTGGTWITGTCTLTIPVAAANFSFSSAGTNKTRNYITAYSCTENVLDLGIVRFRLGWDCHGMTGVPGMWQIHNFSATLDAVSLPSVTVTASSYEVGNEPEDAIDGNLSTRWSAQGIGEWIQFAFSSPQTFNQVSIAFASGTSRLAYFNISVSNDGSSWTQVFSGQSSGTTLQLQNFSIGDVTASYLRITGLGNSQSLWNSLNEISWARVVPPEPSCSDGARNQGETGIDCGGPNCPACPTCYDGIQNQGETGLDCGGPNCPACPTCSDLVQNQGETGVDCGGPNCPACPTCSDGIKNQDETGVDCGGLKCQACPESCSDSIQNQGETGVDCGGPNCPACTIPGTYLRTFYVSNSGSDSNNGTKSYSPWKTIAKVNSQTFLPGDGVLLERGGVWREELKVSSSGNATYYITFGNYGNPNVRNPKILGSNATTTWTETSTGSHIWKTDTTFTNPRLLAYVDGKYNGADISFENIAKPVVWGTYRTSTSLLVAEYDWTWSSSYIYVYSPESPATRYSAVEIPQRDFCFSTGTDTESTYHEYLHIDGIDAAYAAYSGYNTNTEHSEHRKLYGLILENCDVGFIGEHTFNQFGYGAELIYSSMIIRNSVFHSCGRRGVSLDIYGNGFTEENATIENCTFYDGYHTTGVDLNVAAGGFSGSWNNVTVRRNRFYGSQSPYGVSQNSNISVNLLFMQDNNAGGATITNMYIYSNVFEYSQGNAVSLERVTSAYVYNNVFYENNHTYRFSWGECSHHFYADTNCVNITIKNNIFYDTGCVTELSTYQASVSGFDVNYNLYYKPASTDKIIGTLNTFYMNSPKPFSGTGYSWEANGITADPLFVDAANHNFHLQPGSPARGKGIHVPEAATDYDGRAFNATNPSIGAFEYAG
jgi:hypothetical protein